MNDTKQPEAIRLARELEGVYPVNIQDQEVAAAELRRLHLEVEDYKVMHDSLMRQTCEQVGEIVGLKTRIEELEAQLYAVGAGGVGPLMPVTMQHQHNPCSINHLQGNTGDLVTSSSSGVPAGWKLVPVEPTIKMVSEGSCAATLPGPRYIDESAAKKCWAYMLAAAPQPPVMEKPQIGEVVVTTKQQGQCVAVTRQDEDWRILSLIWEAKWLQGEQEPVAYYVERHAPGRRDHGTKLGPFWKREDAEGWLDEHHQLHALYTSPQNLNCKSTQARLATLWGYVKADQQPQGEQWKSCHKIEKPCRVGTWNFGVGNSCRRVIEEAQRQYMVPNFYRQPLTDEQIDKIADGMPGGLEGFLKGWGWRQFASAIIAEYEGAPQTPKDEPAPEEIR